VRRAGALAAKILAALVALLVVVAVVPALLFTRAHAWRTPHPFTGAKVCNPYEATNGAIATTGPGPHWFRANFHTHSSAWEGKQPPCDVVAAYHKLGYEVAEVSDHGVISDTSSCNPEYIPTYEHGANARSVHFTVIDAKAVQPDRYPLWVGLAQKQDTIDRLKSDGSYVVVNHPCHNHGFFPGEFQWLEGYDAVDVQGHFCKDSSFWDSALTAGVAAWCFSGDDVHDVTTPATGARYVYVHAASTSRADVLAALRAGTFVCGFRLDEATEPFVPFPTALTVSAGTISLTIARPAKTIRWIAEGGAILREDRDTDHATFPMGAHSYIRVEAQTGSQRAYFQPVRRCD